MVERLKYFFKSKSGVLAAPVVLLIVVAAWFSTTNLWGKDDDTNTKKQDAVTEKQAVSAAESTKDQTSSGGLPDSAENPLLAPFPNYDDLDPFAEMRLMHERMQRLFDATFNRFRHSPGFVMKGPDYRFSPKMDINEDKQNYIIRMDVPGIDKANLEIKVKDKLLIVSGKREQQRENVKDNNDTKIISYERSFGQFTRACPLPGPFDAKGIKARCKDGVLIITIPKIEASEDEDTIKVEIE